MQDLRSRTWHPAIKKISVERGYDVTRYTIRTVSGAPVASMPARSLDVLGMTRHIYPSLLVLLSAFGDGSGRHSCAIQEHQEDTPDL
ncbi:MAG: hypothetical protein U5N55_08735 [Cypionkella sp.]|nr:hypothetical protein [Cypionkella sp.]